MSRIPGRLAALMMALCALTAVTACSGGDDKPGDTPAANQPDGSPTLQQASTAMAGLKSVAFTLATEDKPPIMVKSGDIKLLKSGDAEGTLQITQSGQSVEMKIVAVGDSIYIKGVTGGWRKVPKTMAAALYDPSAVLDPNRGISKLLTTVAGPKVEGTEKINGKDADRVRGTLPKDTLGGLIPGITSDIQGQVWINKADHRLVRVKAEIPPVASGGDKGSVIINFTEFDAPYTFKAPQ
ncbi:LppX_LprAFG lipoprotein [Spirillospora sp. NPDC047279]|uniref:LppX_LprAFG lipoprotein n=1 Tax=Spirillospora sp. NPDC047279 TaxID=3155478 RepID=UPI0033F14554